MKPEELAQDLLRLANECLRRDQEAESFLIEDGAWRPLLEKEQSQISTYADMRIKELDRKLTALEEPAVQDGHLVPQNGGWTFGELLQRATIREIRRGFLEPVRRLPLVANVPERVAWYFIQLPGGRDFLKRETHSGVGWHYHYLDEKKRRSNVILCWDTRWNTAPTTQAVGSIAPRPLFHENHGEGHARFSARPDLWGNAKRESMHNACSPDLNQWKINEFRCAANKAIAVWPVGATLTPITGTYSSKKMTAPKAGKKKRGR